MAITYLRGFATSSASAPVIGSKAFPLVINAGETAFLMFATNPTAGTVASTITGITGGGTWTRRVVNSAAAANCVEIWSTGVNAATAATSVTASWNKGTGATTQGAVIVGAACYSGVAALGVSSTTTYTANTLTPTGSVTTQDANNVALGAFMHSSATSGTTFTSRASFGTMRVQATDGGASATDVAACFVDLANASAALTTVGVTPGATNIFRVAVLELRSTTGGGGSPAPMPRGYILF